MSEVWSHRGRVDVPGATADNAPEALALASALGAAGAEIDTWLTADGYFVTGHDRATPVGPVDAVARAAVPERPDLAAVVDVAALGTVNVELKVPAEATTTDAGALGRALVAWLSDRSGSADRVRNGAQRIVVSSFAQAATDVVATAGLTVALLCTALPGPGQLRSLAGNGYWGVHSAGAGLDGPAVESAHAAGLAVVAWTVNDLEHANALAVAGLEAIITDVPVAVSQWIGR